MIYKSYLLLFSVSVATFVIIFIHSSRVIFMDLHHSIYSISLLLISIIYSLSFCSLSSTWVFSRLALSATCRLCISESLFSFLSIIERRNLYITNSAKHKNIISIAIGHHIFTISSSAIGTIVFSNIINKK